MSLVSLSSSGRLFQPEYSVSAGLSGTLKIDLYSMINDCSFACCTGVISVGSFITDISSFVGTGSTGNISSTTDFESKEKSLGDASRLARPFTSEWP